MANDDTLLNRAANRITALFKAKLTAQHLYHNLVHTRDTVALIEKIGRKQSLSDELIESLLLAGWFHAAGFTEQYKNQYEKSAAMAKVFLAEEGYDVDKSAEVARLILFAGKRNRKPKGIDEEVLNDGLNAVIADKSFLKRTNLLRLEEEHFLKKEYTDLEWEEKVQDMLLSARFFTKYGRKKFDEPKLDHIDDQKSIIAKAKSKNIREKTGKEFGRGIDTMYRTAYRNHINLSSMADGKANMMISINTLILSGTITLVASSLTLLDPTTVKENYLFLAPLIILLLSSLGSIIVAVVSARPQITKQSIPEDFDLHENKKSVLFFGNFVNFKLPAFLDKLHELKEDQMLVYDNMGIDIYYLGVVLDKKYRQVRLSYNIFMYGLVVAVTVFLITLIVYFQQVGG
ncbi:MAG: Pycsar system effector family protein [Bacteroidota bacterium]